MPAKTQICDLAAVFVPPLSDTHRHVAARHELPEAVCGGVAERSLLWASGAACFRGVEPVNPITGFLDRDAIAIVDGVAVDDTHGSRQLHDDR